MKKQSISRTYCGVPQCKVYRTNGNGVYIFQIPKHVLDSPILSRKWSQVIGIKEPINPRFNICHLHFEKNQVLIPLRGVKRIPVLIKSAFPTLNLPKSKIELINLKVEPVCAVKRSPTHDSDDTVSVKNEIISKNNYCSKSTQANLNPCITLSNLCDTDIKLKSMTGLNNKDALDDLVNASIKLRKEDNVYMAIRDRIILTLCKIKTNFNFEQLGVLFQIPTKTAEDYFADTVNHLAEIVQHSIYWLSKAENKKTLPACCRHFQNLRIVVKMIEINTLKYSKVLIGFAPSGKVIYLSEIVLACVPDKELFLQTDILNKLQTGDALMVDIDLGLNIQNRLFICGVKVIKPESDEIKNKKIDAAKKEIEKSIANLKMFKVLTENVEPIMDKYMKDIIIVLSGLSNKSLLNNSTSISLN